MPKLVAITLLLLVTCTCLYSTGNAENLLSFYNINSTTPNNNNNSNNNGNNGKSDYNYKVTGLTVNCETIVQEEDGVDYVWDFGDGKVVKNEKNVEHTYRDMGNYYACLNVVKPNSKEVVSKKCKHIEILDPNMCDVEWKPVCGCDNQTYVNECHAANYYGVFYWTQGPCEQLDFKLHADFSYTPAGRSYQFLNTSVGNYDSFVWQFSDGRYTGQRNPKHVFAKAGTYEVCLTVSSEITQLEETICDNIVVN